MRRQIPQERKALYYAGMILASIGVLMFLSTFVSFLFNFGNFDNFAVRARAGGLRAIGGVVLMLIGGFLRNVGTKGIAGSGLVLDPDKARQDLEPWSRMSGGIVQDALSEVEVVQKLEDRLAPPKPQIKIRCQKCQALSDEAAKFCNQCGAPV